MHQEPSKIIVLGGRNAGKSALVIRCLTGQFFHNYISGSDTAYHFESNGNVMDIVDSTGRNEALISYADGIILVYSTTDRTSFIHLRYLINKVRRLNLKNGKKIIVVGTKNDKHKQREVSLYEGQEFAVDNKCSFFETSSSVPKQDIQEIFIGLLVKTSKHQVSNNLRNKRRRSMSDTSIRHSTHKIYDSVRNFVQKRRRESTGTMALYEKRELSRSMMVL